MAQAGAAGEGPNRAPQAEVIEAVCDHGPREFALFLGAGASKSSGVPLAGEMIREWRRREYRRKHPAGEPGDAELAAWSAAQPWAQDPDLEYSELFERVYPNPARRQKYIEKKIEPAFPGWGYLCLASIMQAGYFNIAYTTNFDDLINEALSIYLGYNPVVCSAESQVESINATSERAKIIKLHGDYLFKRLKNTLEELAQLDPVMAQKLEQFSIGRGLVVLGYAGRDVSVMSVIEALLERGEDHFETGIYWGIRDGEEPSAAVRRLAERHRERFALVRCNDFDGFMGELHQALALELPESITLPYRTVRRRLSVLVGHEAQAAERSPILEAYRQRLSAQLEGPIAQAENLSQLALLEAQLLLGRRQWQPALEKVQRYLQEQPESADALLVLGGAQMVRSEETGDTGQMREAAASWLRATRLDPTALAPRRCLVGYYMARNQNPEAIEQAEKALDVAPRDVYLRLNLAMLYMRVHRMDEAQRQIDLLVERNPDDASLRGMRTDILAATGRGPEALEEARHAVALDPKNPWFRIGLSGLLFQAGRLADVEAELRAALELDPDNPMALQRLCFVLGATGRAQEADEVFARLQAVAPQMARSLQQQATMAQMQSQMPGGGGGQQPPERALDLLRKLFS